MRESMAETLPVNSIRPNLYAIIFFGLLGGLVGLALQLPLFMMLLAVLAVFICAGVMLVKPERSLWIVISYVLIDYVLREFGPLAFLGGVWDELAFIVITGLWIGRLAWEKEATVQFSPLDWSLLSFVSVTVFLLLMRSPELRIAIEGWRAVAQYVFWFFVVNNLIRSKNQVNILINILLIIATGIALHGIYQYIIGVEIPPEWVDKAEKGIRTRVFSIIGSPNILGSLMVLTLPIALSIMIAAQNWTKRFLLFCAVGAMGLCLLFTFSRGAWLAMIGAIVIFGVLLDKRILAVILIGAIATPVFVPSVAARMSYMLSPEYIKSSQKGGRLVRWEKALDRVEQSPVYGVGLGRFGGAVAKNNDIPGTFYIDNYYLKTLTEMGIVGLGAMLWLFVNCIRLGTAVVRKTKDRYLHALAAGILAGVIGVLLHNAVENIFEVPLMNTYFWVLMGILAGMLRLKEEPVTTALKLDG